MAEYIRRRTTSNMLYDIYEDVVRNILADGKPVHPLLVKNIMLRFEKALNLVPTADVVEVVHGEWVPLEYDGYADGNPVWDLWECSQCREEHSGDEDTLTPYCPNCGAKMDGERKGTNEQE